MLDHAVEQIAVHDPQALAGERRVERFAAHMDVTERKVAELTRGFVVIARHVDDLGAFARFAQHLLHDVVVRLRPVPAFLQLPAVDDVAHEVEVFRLVVPQEVEQIRRLTTARAEVDVGQPDGAVAVRFSVLVVVMSGVRVEWQ